ncbi:hypothetical protein OESDEN_05285, partial [Oesophagostomum dentatum]
LCHTSAPTSTLLPSKRITCRGASCSSETQCSTHSSRLVLSAGADASAQTSPYMCCCKFKVLFESCLVLCALSGALLFAFYVYMFSKFVFEMVITAFAIIIPLYTIWVEKKRHTNDLFLIGVVLIGYGIYIAFKTLLFTSLYFTAGQESGKNA